MNNLGISTFLLTGIQRKILLTQDNLRMGEELDMENMVENFTKILQEEAPGDTWQNCPIRVKRVVDAATDGMLTYLSKHERGGVTDVSPIIPPVQPPSVQPSDKDDEDINFAKAKMVHEVDMRETSSNIPSVQSPPAEPSDDVLDFVISKVIEEVNAEDLNFEVVYMLLTKECSRIDLRSRKEYIKDAVSDIQESRKKRKREEEDEKRKPEGEAATPPATKRSRRILERTQKAKGAAETPTK
jgi:hypothetical protein